MIPPAEACGRGRQAYIDTIPDELREYICDCSTKPWHKVHTGIEEIPNSGDVGIWVHKQCQRPANLWTYIEECENCEYLYVVKRYPDRTLLCESCDF